MKLIMRKLNPFIRLVFISLSLLPLTSCNDKKSEPLTRPDDVFILDKNLEVNIETTNKEYLFNLPEIHSSWGVLCCNEREPLTHFTEIYSSTIFSAERREKERELGIISTHMTGGDENFNTLSVNKSSLNSEQPFYYLVYYSEAIIGETTLDWTEYHYSEIKIYDELN